MPSRIVVSRTDGIGDVILTLPLVGVLKERYPDCHVLFLGSAYARPVVDLCRHVDAFVDWTGIGALDEREQVRRFRELQADCIIHAFPRKPIARLARRSGIPARIGTAGRLYHWTTCNRRVVFSRKASDLHEAQLNLKLLRPLGIDRSFSLDELPGYYGIRPVVRASSLPGAPGGKVHVILHPRSRGSAREWGTENFKRLIQLLPPDEYRISITGTREEGEDIRASGIYDSPHVEDMTGRFALPDLISFIGQADALVAASTGPLHIAAALGRLAIGLYPPIRPMHPGRWAPLGTNAHYLVLDKECNECRRGGPCRCIQDLSPERVRDLLGSSRR
jgi:heptosyltransferase III